MYNMLIAEDNVKQLYLLANVISQEIENIRLSNLTMTGEETINRIETQVADIVLLDLKLADNITGVDIVNYIKNKGLEKYKNSVIIFTGEIELMNKIVKVPYIYSCVQKATGIDTLIKNVKKLLKEKESIKQQNNIKSKIKKELEDLKFDFSYIGTRYLLECIYEIYIRNDYDNINLKSDIYPIIARKYKKSTNNIKCNITQSYIRMSYTCSKKALERYLNIFIGTKKPKIKDIIIEIFKNS